MHEVFTQPQLEARAMIAEVEHPTVGALRLLGLPRKSGEASRAERPLIQTIVFREPLLRTSPL